MIIAYLTKKPLSVSGPSYFSNPALHIFHKYETTDYEPAIFVNGIQKSHGFIIFPDAATIFKKCRVHTGKL